MQLFCDDQPVAGAPPDIETIADTLRHVQSSVCHPERLVVRLRCDGQDVVSDGIETVLARQTSTVERLEVFTATRKGLVANVMNHASSSLQETEDAARRVADMLTEGKTREAMETFGECLRIWQQIHQAVTKSVAMLALDIEKITIQDEPMIDIISRPKDILVQVREALVNKDHVLLADLLQYEFRDVTDQWFAVIARIREEVESQA